MMARLHSSRGTTRDSGRGFSARPCAEKVERTSRRIAEFLDHVGIDHRRFHVGVPEIFLNLPDVDTIEQQMRGERVTK
jgi:hypothetical protein